MVCLHVDQFFYESYKLKILLFLCLSSQIRMVICFQWSNYPLYSFYTRMTLDTKIIYFTKLVIYQKNQQMCATKHQKGRPSKGSSIALLGFSRPIRGKVNLFPLVLEDVLRLYIYLYTIMCYNQKCNNGISLLVTACSYARRYERYLCRFMRWNVLFCYLLLQLNTCNLAN